MSSGSEVRPAQAGFTRRELLLRMGAMGGSAALYGTALALGWVPALAVVERPNLMPLRGRERSVAILGAGIGGLVAAYELERAGYRCTILEASGRAGGRNLTLRHGDRVDELGHPQICRFDPEPHLYFNAGAARIPSSHAMLLTYCRELGVELAPFVNENRNAWVQDDAMANGRRMRNREYVTDARGFMAELLAKGAFTREMDTGLSPEDSERFLDFVRAYGDLAPDGKYRGSYRAGSATPGMTELPALKPATDFRELLKSTFWRFSMHFGEFEDQAAMLEPVGGMDQIVRAFMNVVGDRVQLGAQVEAVMLRDSGVNVAYRQAGERRHLSVDYCLNSIPLHLMAGIPNNFPKAYSEVFLAMPRGKLFKMGLQANERFWEREHIYGGISWTSQTITQLWYPSHGFHKPKGVILAAYSFLDALGERMAALTPEERIELAVQQGETLHPGYRGYIENGVSVAWHRMDHMLGCSAVWTEDLRRRWFRRLQDPVGHHYMIGDQVSLHPGWQEGAVHSALHAIADVDRRVRRERSSRDGMVA